MISLWIILNINPLIEAVHCSDYDCTFYWANWVRIFSIISSLKSILGSAVCGTVLQLLCPLFEFDKHYISECKFLTWIIVFTEVIIRKFERGIGRKPAIGNISEFGGYWWRLLSSARNKGDWVKSEGRKAEDEDLRPIAHAEVGERRVHRREARG